MAAAEPDAFADFVAVDAAFFVASAALRVDDLSVFISLDFVTALAPLPAVLTAVLTRIVPAPAAALTASLATFVCFPARLASLLLATSLAVFPAWETALEPTFFRLSAAFPICLRASATCFAGLRAIARTSLLVVARWRLPAEAHRDDDSGTIAYKADEKDTPVSQLWGAIKSRLTEPPLPLKAHALAMLALPFVIAGPETTLRWFGVTMVAAALWPVLRGSLYGWWIQAAVVAITTAGLVRNWWFVADEHPELSIFVSPATFVVALQLLTIAAATLLAPATRAFCRDSRDGPRTRWGLALGALLVGSLPAVALSVEPRLPPRPERHTVTDLMVAGSDPVGPSVLYVGKGWTGRCLVVVEPRAISDSCPAGHSGHHGDPPFVRTEHLQAWLLPPRAVHAKVLYGKRPPRNARLLSGAAARANVFVVTDDLNDVVGIKAYDARGRRIVGCRYYC